MTAHFLSLDAKSFFWRIIRASKLWPLALPSHTDLILYSEVGNRHTFWGVKDQRVNIPDYKMTLNITPLASKCVLIELSYCQSDYRTDKILPHLPAYSDASPTIWSPLNRLRQPCQKPIRRFLPSRCLPRCYLAWTPKCIQHCLRRSSPSVQPSTGRAFHLPQDYWWRNRLDCGGRKMVRLPCSRTTAASHSSRLVWRRGQRGSSLCTIFAGWIPREARGAYARSALLAGSLFRESEFPTPGSWHPAGTMGSGAGGRDRGGGICRGDDGGKDVIREKRFCGRRGCVAEGWEMEG